MRLDSEAELDKAFRKAYTQISDGYMTSCGPLMGMLYLGDARRWKKHGNDQMALQEACHAEDAPQRMKSPKDEASVQIEIGDMVWENGRESDVLQLMLAGFVTIQAAPAIDRAFLGNLDAG